MLGCDDHVEMPGGYATVSWDRPDLADGERANAELERIDAWYRDAWADVGWRAEPAPAGMASAPLEKAVDGRRLRAGIDAISADGFEIYVVGATGGLCE